MKKVHFTRTENGRNLPLCGPPWVDATGAPTWVGTNSPDMVTCLLCERAITHVRRNEMGYRLKDDQPT